uniref:Fibronectin type-III domain-containing protein n=1 Tax=Rhabditophanes sp. KR3021 TaxID=114890 RepID=A0AC35THH4_9BILA
MYYFKVDRTSYNKTAFGKWFGYKTPKAHFVIPIDDIDPPMGVSYKVVEPGQVAISWKSVKEYEGYTGYAIEVYCKSYNRTFFIRKLYDDSHMLENVDFRYPVSFTIAMQNNFIVSKRKSNKLSIKPLLDIEGFALNPSPVFSQRTLTTFLFIAITIIVVSVFSYIFYKLHYWRSKKGRVCIQNGIVDYNRFNYGRNPENYVRPDNDFEIRMAAIKQLIDEGHIMG